MTSRMFCRICHLVYCKSAVYFTFLMLVLAVQNQIKKYIQLAFITLSVSVDNSSRHLLRNITHILMKCDILRIY